MKILSVILLLGFYTVRGAEPSADLPPEEVLKDVSEIPVLFNGRVMPLDSFARLHLLQFSGRKTFRGESAMAWMGRLLFKPESTENDAVFLINHPELLDAMDVERSQVIEGKRKPSTRRFSYLHLETGITQLMEIAQRAQQMQNEDSEALKGKEFLVEREALRVYHNILTYRALSQVFAYSRELPGLVIDNPEVREALQLEEGDTTFTYLDLRSRVGGLTPLMEQAHKLGGPETWNEPQQDAMTLAQLMYSFHVNLSELPLTLLPEAPHGESIWIAPMDALHRRDGDKALIHAGERAGLLAQSWRAGNWSAVSEESKALTEFSRGRMDHVRETNLTGKEAHFNRANYFGRAKIFYILAFFLSFGALLSGGNKLRWAAWMPLLIALGLHMTGIAWRIYLTARPPVTNLYGTFLFVGLICLLLAVLVEFFQKNGLGIFAGSFIALTFLLIAVKLTELPTTINAKM